MASSVLPDFNFLVRQVLESLDEVDSVDLNSCIPACRNAAKSTYLEFQYVYIKDALALIQMVAEHHDQLIAEIKVLNDLDKHSKNS